MCSTVESRSGPALFIFAPALFVFLSGALTLCPRGYAMSKAKGGDGGVDGDLSMSPEQMLELARQTAELVVRRIENLPGEGAWEGEFRRELEDRLLKPPPEESRSASQVIEEVAHEILPIALRLDHPRCLDSSLRSPLGPECWPTS